MKPCPFCGGEGVDAEDGYVRCSHCECDGPFGVEAYIDAWNRRPIEDALREEKQALRSALSSIVEIAGREEDPEILLHDIEKAALDALTRGIRR
jgi:hypothetical protein